MSHWADSHCHLPADATEAAGWLHDANAAGVDLCINVGTDVESSAVAADIASDLDGVWATAGVHPHDAKDGIEGLAALLDRPEVVAVGECGLDYHYDHSPREVQRTVFAAQIALARAAALPLVIHTREAWDDTFAVLAEVGVPEPTIFHCFSGGQAEARRALDVGALLSFSGVVTFKSADDVRDAAVLCPLDRLLIETDSPYLAPVPHRGKPNRPGYVGLVGAAVAAAKGVEPDNVAQVTRENLVEAFVLVN